MNYHYNRYLQNNIDMMISVAVVVAVAVVVVAAAVVVAVVAVIVIMIIINKISMSVMNERMLIINDMMEMTIPTT